MRQIPIETASGASSILVGHDLEIQPHLASRQTVVVADSNVTRLHADRLAGFDVIELESSEENKSLETVHHLYSEFFKRKLERSACVVAVGGGIIGDMAGFAAATYLRGISFGVVATTLLAQVDASIGGKNGVNFQGHKNLVGVIRQPQFCLCDTSFLRTLPKRELSCGFAEVIKHACIENLALFEYLESHATQAFALEQAVIDSVVYESILIKAKIVEMDETEQGVRRNLNFGHTLGHAIELLHGIPHGEAVSIGMILESRLSLQRGLLSELELKRMEALCQAFHLPTRMHFEREAVLENISRDKKKAGAGVYMTLLRGLGNAELQKISLDEIAEIVS